MDEECLDRSRSKSKSNTPKIPPPSRVWGARCSSLILKLQDYRATGSHPVDYLLLHKTEQRRFRGTFCFSPYNPSWKIKCNIFQLYIFWTVRLIHQRLSNQIQICLHTLFIGPPGLLSSSNCFSVLRQCIILTLEVIQIVTSMKVGTSYDFFADVASLCFTARHGAW